MKVFISSVISGYEEYRRVVKEAVEMLGHEVVRAEDFGAAPASPRVTCLAGVRSADMVVLLIGQRYGALQTSGKSATHEEFDEAYGRKEVVAFVEEVPHREPHQEQFLKLVQDWQAGLFTQTFCGSRDLQRIVTRALHDRIVEKARGFPDAAEVMDRALALLPDEQRGWMRSHPILAASFAGGPKQVLLRPAELESEELDRRIFQIALHGPHTLFDRREGTERECEGGSLLLRQASRSVNIRADGSIMVQVPVLSDSNIGALIEEDVRDLILRTIGFFGEALTQIDETERLRSVCVAAVVQGAEYAGWRTRAEDQRSPTTMTMSMNGERRPVTTGVTPRAFLRTRTKELAEDLTVLMRQGFSR